MQREQKESYRACLFCLFPKGELSLYEKALKAWFSEAENSQWRSPSDIKKTYPHASILPDNRMVFNIKGNTYRLIVKINYDYGQVFIRFVGTHAEYDKIDATTI